MLPADWADTSAQRAYALPRDLDGLRARYSWEGVPRQLENVLAAMAEAGADVAYLEAPYVDTDFRAEFSHYFSRSFRPTSDKCERLLFFAQGNLVGMTVLRPLPAAVGRTVLAPSPESMDFVTCVAPQPVRPWGLDRVVQGYPFTSQDGEYGRCAHAAIWSIARYHHLRYGFGRRSIAAIIEAAGVREEPDRTLPSGGLWMAEVVAAFRRLGLPATLYNPDDLPRGETVESLVCRYLDSGFPIALNTPGHLTVLVGYGVAPGGSVFFVRSDDNHGPYECVQDWRSDSLGKWDLLAVPMPGRFHVPGEAAEVAATIAMRDYLGVAHGPQHLLAAWNAGDVRRRTYAQQAADYKVDVGRIPSRDIAVHHRSIPASGWVWVVEMRDDADNGRLLGEIVVDATSFQRRPQPLFGNVDGVALWWSPGSELPYRSRKEASGFRYGSSLPSRLKH